VEYAAADELLPVEVADTNHSDKTAIAAS